LPAIALAAMLVAPATGSAQSILLTASNYALLGGTAISVGGPGPNAITNGHVGLWSGATSNISGFPPATVSGITRSGATAAIIATGALTTGQAMADLQRAHTGLAGMPSNVNLSNVDLGTVAPLSAGVYTFNEMASLTGALVLDAQGQNNVAWVFQIGTSLTTAANSTVTFINLGSNGGSDLGLFWNAGAAITIGDNNTTAGNYIAGTSISFTGITTTVGVGGTRALALAAVSFAGPGAINALGGGGREGGLMYDSNGNVVPIPPAIVVPPDVIPPDVVPPDVVPPVVIPPVVVPPVVAPGGLVVPPVVPGTAYTGSVLLSSTGAYAPGASGVILVPGTAYATSSMTVDGLSRNGSADASLTITTATVALSGVNTYTGGTLVDGAVLIASSANLPTNRNITLTNGGSLILNQSVNGVFGGVASGTGSVTKLGSGTLTYLGANSYTGGTYVSGGALVASTVTLPANQKVTVASGSALIFDQAVDGTFGGAITGGGAIQKRGVGALTFTIPTTSTIDVQAGRFYLNTGVGRTTVSAGALLGGTGTITGNLVNHGTVSPGTSPGTINVTGNYTQSATGNLVIELASASSFDQVVVTGTASLAGGLQVNTLGNYNPLGRSFTFLTAAGGVSGTFGPLAGNLTSSAATRASVVYAPTTATLVFSQLPFAGFAETPNQEAVAAAAQDVPELTAVLNTLPLAGQFPAALNALSPQGYQVWSDFAFAHSTSLADRLMRDNRAISSHDEYYFEGGQRRGRSRSDLDVGSSRYTSSHGLVGGNHAVTADTAVGAFFAFGKTTAGLGSAGSQTTVKDKTLGVRAAWVGGPLFAEALVAYGFNRYESTRPIEFPGTSAVATSFTRGHQWTAGMTVGKHLTSGRLTASPFVGLLASRWTGNRFTEEDAGAFNATVHRQSARSLRSQLGVEGRLMLGRLQPHVRGAWLHEFSNDSRGMNASFGGVDYTVVTRRAPRDTALYGAGLDFVLGPRAFLYTNVAVQSGGTTKVLNEWNAGVSISF
jgi:outer membrane autotransporter protein